MSHWFIIDKMGCEQIELRKLLEQLIAPGRTYTEIAVKQGAIVTDEQL
jgi:hypothetical protein